MYLSMRYPGVRFLEKKLKLIYDQSKRFLTQNSVVALKDNCRMSWKDQSLRCEELLIFSFELLFSPEKRQMLLYISNVFFNKIVSYDCDGNMFLDIGIPHILNSSYLIVLKLYNNFSFLNWACWFNFFLQNYSTIVVKIPFEIC